MQILKMFFSKIKLLIWTLLEFQPGCVSKFKLDVKNIVGTVAKDAENKGHFEDAAMLYDLADVGFAFYISII